MYRASDVLLAATCAEGFGVPIIEAQLCGTPVVTNRTTAMSELTLFGESCQTGSWLLRRDFNSGWFHPDTDRVAEALERISQWSKDRKDKMFRKV
jgi:glycosyltransferase involved in cell wall biosynthesis